MSDERIQDNSGEELDDNIIILNDEEGKENRFEFLDLVELDNEEYIVLLPADEEESDEPGEVVILKVEDSEDGSDEESYVSVDDEEVLNKLDDLAIDGDGVVMLDRTQYLPETHRHFSHLMCLYPLHLINYDTDEHKKIFENTILNLETLGTGYWVGFSFAMSAQIYAMAKKGNSAGERLNQFCKGFVGENGFHLNGDFKRYGYTWFHYRPFTLESLYGFCDALHEMLMQDHTGEIELFPAIPDEWRKKSVEFKNLRARGGILISARMEKGIVNRLTIRAERDGEVIIDGMRYRLKAGENAIIR